mmetsp:Transcript_14070/g.48479  ORF Transcript_14070/g.48479 Transcript_14070/m.48479 type:complete len:244 (-) Transcript_14070:40-771(-)
MVGADAEPCSHLVELQEFMASDAARQERLVAVIAVMLQETVNATQSLCRPTKLSSFDGPKPHLSASSYVKRIMKYSDASPCCLVVGAIYLERLKKRDDMVALTVYNFQRLFLVAVMLASKFLDDAYASNRIWAEIGGLMVEELNHLELEFLYRIAFSLSISREEYDWYAEELHRRADLQERECPENPASATREELNSSLDHDLDVVTRQFAELESQLSRNSTPTSKACWIAGQESEKVSLASY